MSDQPPPRPRPPPSCLFRPPHVVSPAMRPVFRHTLAALSLAAAAWPFRSAAAEPVPPPPPPLHNATLAPALRAAADRDGIKVYHIDAPGADPLAGDATVAWIGAHDGKVTRQWLIQFRRSIATSREQAAAKQSDKTKYLSWGPIVTFRSEAQALDLWIAGPVVVSPATTPAPAIAPVKRRRVFVPSDYLRLGLDNSLRVEEHIRRRADALTKENPAFKLGHLYALEKPVKPAAVDQAKPVADQIGFTPEMERAWTGGFIALQAFYELANDVPEIEVIAAVAFQKPAVWKLAKVATGTMFQTFLGGPSTQRLDPAKIGLIPVATETLDAPFQFQFGYDPIVSGRLVVSTPTPPFDTTAGVLALVGVHPQDARRVVHMITIAAVRGPTPATEPIQ